MVYVTVVGRLALPESLAQVQGAVVEGGAVVAVTLEAVGDLSVLPRAYLVQMIGLVQCKILFLIS